MFSHSLSPQWEQPLLSESLDRQGACGGATAIVEIWRRQRVGVGTADAIGPPSQRAARECGCGSSLGDRASYRLSNHCIGTVPHGESHNPFADCGP